MTISQRIGRIGFAGVGLLLAGLTLAPGRAAAVTATLVGDTYTISSSANAIKGATGTLEVNGAAAPVKNVYLKFDLGTLPVGTTGNDVAKATLTLFVNKVTTPGSFDVLRVTTAAPDAWSEATLNALAAATLTTTTETSALPVASTDKNKFKTVDLTNLVKAWIDATQTNNGIELIANTGDGLNAKFDSRENGSKSHPPELEITLIPQVTSANIVNGTITNADIAPGTITSGNINLASITTLTGANITNGSIGSADINLASITTLTGANVTNGGLRNVDIDFSSASGTGNTQVGFGALAFNTTGNDNTATGNGALGSNTAGGSNTAMGAAALASNTDGSFNTAVGDDALGTNMDGADNTAVGVGALAANLSGSGNTAVGLNALFLTKSDFNVAVGNEALGANNTGGSNTAVGSTALFGNTTGDYNVAVGADALHSNVSTDFNTAVGHDALGLSTGTINTALGAEALDALASGNGNTGIGVNALGALTSGSDNIALGNTAGLATTSGSDNIYIGNTGANESGTVRIGTLGTHTSFYLRGVRGVTTSIADAIPVLIASNGQLGTVSSSRRFKTAIDDMSDASSPLLKLRPVTFKYKPNLDPSGTLQYGLIAEEVERVMPNLVVYDADGKPETVKYHLLAALLLNELQKQHHLEQTLQADLDRQQRQVEQQVQFIAALRAQSAELRLQNAALQQRLDRVEQTVEAAIRRQAPGRLASEAGER